jgi:hypothetical protein
MSFAAGPDHPASVLAVLARLKSDFRLAAPTASIKLSDIGIGPARCLLRDWRLAGT